MSKAQGCENTSCDSRWDNVELIRRLQKEIAILKQRELTPELQRELDANTSRYDTFCKTSIQEIETQRKTIENLQAENKRLRLEQEKQPLLSSYVIYQTRQLIEMFRSEQTRDRFSIDLWRMTLGNPFWQEALALAVPPSNQFQKVNWGTTDAERVKTAKNYDWNSLELALPKSLPNKNPIPASWNTPMQRWRNVGGASQVRREFAIQEVKEIVGISNQLGRQDQPFPAVLWSRTFGNPFWVSRLHGLEKYIPYCDSLLDETKLGESKLIFSSAYIKETVLPQVFATQDWNTPEVSMPPKELIPILGLINRTKVTYQEYYKNITRIFQIWLNQIEGNVNKLLSTQTKLKAIALSDNPEWIEDFDIVTLQDTQIDSQMVYRLYRNAWLLSITDQIQNRLNKLANPVVSSTTNINDIKFNFPPDSVVELETVEVETALQKLKSAATQNNIKELCEIKDTLINATAKVRTSIEVPETHDVSFVEDS